MVCMMIARRRAGADRTQRLFDRRKHRQAGSTDKPHQVRQQVLISSDYVSF
jgi:hypothetical protein